MTETNVTPWTETEPEVRGKVTRKERPVPIASSDDKLRAGMDMLADAAKTANQSQESKIAEVRKSLAPVVKEAAALLKTFEELSSMYMSRLEELASAARSRDLRRYNGIDDALTRIDRAAHEAIQMLASGQRVLSTLPRRVRDLTWTEVQTRKYEDFARDVACLRDGPKYVRGCVEEAEKILAKVEAIVARSKPTRLLIEPYDDSPRPERQIRADDDWNAFPGTPDNLGQREPFAL